MTRIVIVGAGGHGAVVADMLEEAIGFVDDDLGIQSTEILGLPLLGRIDDLARIDHDAVIVAIGDNATRKGVTKRLVAAGEKLATAIHPTASIARSAQIGEGSMISAGAVILPRATLRRGVIMNSKASVDHDTVIGEFAHVAVGASVGARITIGEETLVAMGATVVSGVNVGARCIVGAGAVVVRDVPDDTTVFGVPARVTRHRRR